MAGTKGLVHNPDYSTLEVSNGEAWAHTRDEPQVFYDGNTLPELAPQPPEEKHALPDSSEEKRILGLKKKWFILVVVIAIVIVVGVGIGIGVGVTRGRGFSAAQDNTQDNTQANPKTEPTNNGTTSHDSPVLAESQLAAVNWTDPGGNHFRAVFWQARETDSIMMSLWDSANATWEVVDIGASAEREEPNFSLGAQRGTSLAAVVNGAPYTGDDYGYFRLVVVYVDARGLLSAIASEHPRGALWWFDDIARLKRRDRPSAYPGAQVAAWFSACRSSHCNNARLFYQDGDQQLCMMRRANYNQAPACISTSALQPGTGLAVAPVSRDWDLNDLMILYDESNVMRQRMEEAETGYGSNITGTPEVLTVESGLAGQAPRIATLAFTPEGGSAPEDALAVTRSNNGTLLVNHWNESLPGTFPDQKWSGAAPPTMQGSTIITNFTSIAVPALDELSFFGLAPEDGLIHWYTMDRRDPLSWTYQQPVPVE